MKDQDYFETSIQTYDWSDPVLNSIYWGWLETRPLPSDSLTFDEMMIRVRKKISEKKNKKYFQKDLTPNSFIVIFVP